MNFRLLVWIKRILLVGKIASAISSKIYLTLNSCSKVNENFLIYRSNCESDPRIPIPEIWCSNKFAGHASSATKAKRWQFVCGLCGRITQHGANTVRSRTYLPEVHLETAQHMSVVRGKIYNISSGVRLR